ncbi:MAG TPA: methionyl-tRNA formyltransferase [Anaerolineae bacterium]|jgi:methionyl-tRNA formyltransferase
MTRILFMGTPSFAVPVLAAIARGYDVVAVVTQPDAPSGRGRTLNPSAVKLFAQARLPGVPILQPESLKPPEVVAQLRATAPDVIVVAAFGQILRRDVLSIPPHACINVHASLLPRWRGASPISAAIAAGDAVTGVTIMLMEAGLDSGPILSQRSTPIASTDTTATLSERLSTIGASLLVETLPGWLSGQLAPQPQDATLVTKCGQLKKEDGRIDWTRDAGAIERQIRALTPWPGASTVWHGRQLQIKRARVFTGTASFRLETGIVAEESRDAICVQCGEGLLELLEVQLEGKRAISIAEFTRGQRQFIGSRLGGE